MTMKMKLCNVHKMAFANEGEERKPIHIPFGTWDYDDRITQTLDRAHAEGIANELEKSIAAGEPGIPVYQGHPDVPEYAGKYPDKGALGWVKKIMVNEDGMDLVVEWDRDPGKGFGWFSPYWVGDNPTVGADGKKNVVVDGLTSVGLVNNPNIREFRLANEAGEDLTQRRGGAENAEFLMPAHLVALAKRFDERRALPNVVDANGMGHSDENGRFDGSGSGGGGSSQSARLDRLQGEARNKIAAAKEGAAASRARRGKYSAELESRVAEIRKKTASLKDFNDKMEARLRGMPNEANFDESKHPRANDGKFSSTGGGGGSSADGGASGEGNGTDFSLEVLKRRKWESMPGAKTPAARKEFSAAQADLIAGQKRGWSKDENNKAYKRWDLARRKLLRASEEDNREWLRRNPIRRDALKSDRIDALWKELAAKFEAREAARNR